MSSFTTHHSPFITSPKRQCGAWIKSPHCIRSRTALTLPTHRIALFGYDMFRTSFLDVISTTIYLLLKPYFCCYKRQNTHSGIPPPIHYFCVYVQCRRVGGHLLPDPSMMSFKSTCCRNFLITID